MFFVASLDSPNSGEGLGRMCPRFFIGGVLQGLECNWRFVGVIYVARVVVTLRGWLVVVQLGWTAPVPNIGNSALLALSTWRSI